MAQIFGSRLFVGCFSVIWVPKLLLIPVKIRIFVPKTAKIGIFGQILAFLVYLAPCPTKEQCKQEAQAVFSVTWVSKLLLPPIKNYWADFFPQGGGVAGSFGALLVGSCGARAESCKTPIYFILLIKDLKRLARNKQTMQIICFLWHPASTQATGVTCRERLEYRPGNPFHNTINCMCPTDIFSLAWIDGRPI